MAKKTRSAKRSSIKSARRARQPSRQAATSVPKENATGEGKDAAAGQVGSAKSRSKAAPSRKKTRKTKGTASAGKKRAVSARRTRTRAKAAATKSAARVKAGAIKPARGKRAGVEPVPIVGVGASAGGLEAFTLLLKALPADTGMAFVLISHLSHTHKSLLSELLAKATQMPVTPVGKSTLVQPNHVYVIPPNTDLDVSDGRVTANPITELRRPHMPIDHFLRSLARNRKSRAIGVILSGSGSDGTLGLTEIKAEGGITFAQDDASAKYPDMPRSASAGAGSADFVLPPEGIAAELTRIGRHPYVVQPRPPVPAEAPARPRDEFQQIFDLLRSTTGVDFSHYKPTTIRRRISRRMLLHRIDTPAEYLKRVRSDPGEVQALYQDLLINVTGFFRDREVFETLQKNVIPKIVKSQPTDAPIRVWVSGGDGECRVGSHQ